MPVRARVLDYAVALDGAWDVTGDRGGTPLPGAEREQWTPEHLVLAAVARCVLAALVFHAERAGVAVTPGASARGSVTRRDEDGRFAFVEIAVDLDVGLTPAPEPDAVAELCARAERGCFVGASLKAAPVYRWTVNGREIG